MHSSRTSSWMLTTVLLGSVAGIGACASSEEVDSVPLPPGGARSGTTLSVKVWSSDSAKPAPLEGVTIVLDRAAGRAEKTTNVNGIAQFAGIDPRTEGVAITLYKPGYQLVSALDVADRVTAIAQGSVLELTTHRVAPHLVSVLGVASGLHDPGDWLRVSASAVPSSAHLGVGPVWWLKVPAGAPLELVGIDFEELASPEPNAVERRVHGWAKARLADPRGWVVLDFDQSLSPNHATGSFPMLKRDGVPAYLPGSSASMEVYGGHFSHLVGMATRTWREPVRGQWHFAAEYVKVLPASDIFYRVSQLGPYSSVSGQTRSSLYFKGYPSSGELPEELPQEPELIVQERSAETSFIAWKSGGHRPVNSIQLRQGGPAGPVVWELSVDASASSGRSPGIQLPSLPSSADMDPMLKAPLTVSVRHCEIDPAFDPALCKAESVSRAAPLTTPLASAKAASVSVQTAP